jgi:hypothetical protein
MAALTSAVIINSINNDFVLALAARGAAFAGAGAAAAFDPAAFKTGCEAAAGPPPTFTQASIAAGVIGAAGLGLVAGDLNTLVTALAAKEVLNAKTNKLIYHVPKSDEILRRCVATLYSKSKGVDIYNVAVPAVAGVPAVPANYLTTMSGDLVDSMPKSEGDVYISLLTITPAQKESLKRYDERVEKIRAVLSEGISAAATSIAPANVVSRVSRNSVSVFSSYPPGLQEVLKERRKSDPSNPLNVAATLNRIRVSMNGGANNMIGGNASKAAPLYPRFVMHGGAHPLAVMEGGAAPGAGLAVIVAPPGAPNGAFAPARASPNPVAVLDSRIRELEEQFKTATGSRGLAGELSTQIRGYADTVNNGIRDLQQNLKELSEANAALAQYPVGLGMDASTFDGDKLRSLSAQADKINKDALKAGKQLDKLEQIKNTLEDLVNKSNPVGRA